MAKKKDPANPPADPSSPPAATGAATATVGRPANLPTRCRIVEYTTEEGETIPAIVTQVRDDELHLAVFDPLFGAGLKCISLEKDGRDAAGEPRTWNWPARQ